MKFSKILMIAAFAVSAFSMIGSTAAYAHCGGCGSHAEKVCEKSAKKVCEKKTCDKASGKVCEKKTCKKSTCSKGLNKSSDHNDSSRYND